MQHFGYIQVLAAVGGVAIRQGQFHSQAVVPGCAGDKLDAYGNGAVRWDDHGLRVWTDMLGMVLKASPIPRVESWNSAVTVCGAPVLLTRVTQTW